MFSNSTYENDYLFYACLLSNCTVVFNESMEAPAGLIKAKVKVENEKVKEVFLGKKIRIIIDGIHIETEEELVKEMKKSV